MTYRLFIVDAFASKRFSGNPAAVCILPEEKDAAWMLAVAAELNLSETAFVVSQDDSFQLRWFTPSVEVALCGHATLAAAHVLWESEILKASSAATFDTLSGRLTATKTGSWIVLDFPGLDVAETTAPKEILDAINVHPKFIGKSRFDYFIEVESEEEVRRAAPNLHVLAKESQIRGWIITAPSSSPEYDFVSRFFAPAAGIDEDPVTGSAHCCLAPYWSKKFGRSELTGFQASRRGGIVNTAIRGSRVELSGQAITVVTGKIH